MTVSVVVPFRDGERYLAEAIASVQAQTVTEWELVLVDDGSTDGSHRIAAAAAEADHRICLLGRPFGTPGSAAAARNLGIDAARGEFVAFLDADDVYEPDNLSTLLAGFQDHPEVMMVYGPTRWWHPRAEDRDWVEGMRREAGRVHRPPELVNRVVLLQRGQVPCTCSVLIRRRALQATGGFDETFQLYEDQTLWVKLLLRFPAYVTDVAGARYRQHGGSTTARSEQAGVYVRTRPHQARAAFLDWIGEYARAAGLADRSVQRALRLASAAYGDGRTALSATDRLALACYRLEKRVRSVLHRLLVP